MAALREKESGVWVEKMVVGAIMGEMQGLNILANTVQQKTTRVQQQSLVILQSDLNKPVSLGRKCVS